MKRFFNWFLVEVPGRKIDWVWKVFPLNRPQKELLKYLIFSMHLPYYKKWRSYRNWYVSRIFSTKPVKISLKNFKKRFVYNEYSSPVKPDIQLGKMPGQVNRLAVVVHAYYPEVFKDIVLMLNKSDFLNTELYVTHTKNQLSHIKEVLSLSNCKYSTFEVNNHGRDILPFLKVLPIILQDGHDVVLKLHTKKSDHLAKKTFWREVLLEKLIGENKLKKVISLFNKNSHIGMVGPKGNIVPMCFYYGGNAERLRLLSKKMGVSEDKLSGLTFVAGSMFYARKEVLVPFLNLGLKDEDFEREEGQLDDTMAHVVERAFALGLLVSGLKLVDSDADLLRPSLTITNNHIFSA